MNEPSRNNSIHGLLWNKTMTVVDSVADDVHAFVRLEYTFNQEGVVESGVLSKQCFGVVAVQQSHGPYELTTFTPLASRLPLPRARAGRLQPYRCRLSHHTPCHELGLALAGAVF
jgi:hypothetical protein